MRSREISSEEVEMADDAIAGDSSVDDTFGIKRIKQQPGSGMIEVFIKSLETPGVAWIIIIALLAFGIFNGTD